jgi:hypothetical protein
VIRLSALLQPQSAAVAQVVIALHLQVKLAEMVDRAVVDQVTSQYFVLAVIRLLDKVTRAVTTQLYPRQIIQAVAAVAQVQ